MLNGGFKRTKPRAELGYSWGCMKQGKMCNTHCSKALVKMISTSTYKNTVVLKNHRNGPNSISANVGTHRLQKPQQIPESPCFLQLFSNWQPNCWGELGGYWKAFRPLPWACAYNRSCPSTGKRQSWIPVCSWVQQCFGSFFQRIKVRWGRCSRKTWPPPPWSSHACWLFPIPSICLSRQDFGVFLCSLWWKRHQSCQQSGDQYNSSAHICVWHLLLRVSSWILLGQLHVPSLLGAERRLGRAHGCHCSTNNSLRQKAA